MGNSLSLCDNVTLRRQLTVLVVGLDNAGKTCASRALVGETFVNVTPTIGFSKLATRHRGITINIYDLGGNSKIREIWHNYFAEAYGVVYVVDASDLSRMSEAHNILCSLMRNPVLMGKPFLLLANKQDNSQALDEIDVAEKLHLEMLANECQTPTRIEVCSATQGTGKHIDPIIRVGFEWLVENILQKFDTIHQRVTADVRAQKEHEQEEKDARQERIRLSQENDSLTDVSSLARPIENKQPENASAGWNLPGSIAEVVETPSYLENINSSTEALIDQSNGMNFIEEGTVKDLHVGRNDRMNPLEGRHDELEIRRPYNSKVLPPLRMHPQGFN